MNHKISASTLCLLLLLAVYTMNNILSIIANMNADDSIITPSTTIILEISMVNATTPSIIVNTGINHCRTVVSTITVSVTFYDDCD